MAYFRVQLNTPHGIQEFECPDDEYILEAAENAGIDMTYSCRAGACSSCAAKIIDGTLDQRDQSFLDHQQMQSGYALLCVAYATSQLVLRTNCEEEIW